jgi:thioredoxin-like negative regulator of GroEL
MERRSEMVNPAKYEVLKAMNRIMVRMNDMRAYDEWILVVPDEASDEDLMRIAEDVELYAEAEALFFRICNRYGSTGLFFSW